MSLSLALLAAAAVGQSPDRGDLDAIFSAMDRDGDGYVTAAEAPQARSVRISDCRGTVRTLGSWVARHDSDGDGRVSRREFVGRALTEIAAYRR